MKKLIEWTLCNSEIPDPCYIHVNLSCMQKSRFQNPRRKYRNYYLLFHRKFRPFDRNNNIDAKDLTNTVCSWMDELFPEPTHPNFCKFLLQEVRKNPIELFETITIESYKQLLHESYKQLLHESTVHCYTKESYKVCWKRLNKVR